MGQRRKPRRDGEETREAILRAADSLFSERGLKGTSLKAIAERSGVSQALVQHHFAGKEALWQEARRRLVARFTAAQVLPAPGEPLDRAKVRAGFRGYFRFSLENPDALRFSMWIRLQGDGGDSGGEAEIFEKLQQMAAEAQAQGLLRQDIPTFDLLMAFGGMVRMWALEQPHFSDIAGLGPVDSERSERYFDHTMMLLEPQ